MKLIEVHYTPKQVSCPDSSSPSPPKQGLVVDDWVAQGLPISVVTPVPASLTEIKLAHFPSYVDGIQSCELPNGFRGRQKDVADSLPWTCGSPLSAARGALDSRGVACSPTSGFHHAGYESGYGYCTFNGLMVTALALKAEGRIGRVGILDCDQHYGDGTAEIISTLKIDWIRHVSAEYWKAADARPFIDKLPEVVGSLPDCDLLIYQAGADPHINDSLGVFMTTAQMAERDEIVFSGAKSIGIPLVWNLAGGYQEPLSGVLEIHRNTMAVVDDSYIGRRQDS